MDSKQFRIMVICSLLAHIVVLIAGIVLYTFRSQAVPMAPPENVPIVELYDIAEIPENVLQEIEPLPQEEPPEERILALQNIPMIGQPPMPTPTLPPLHTPTPTPLPTIAPTPTLRPIIAPTPTLRPIITPTPTLRPKPRPTSTPRPGPTPTPQKQAVAALDVPRREAVLSPETSKEELQKNLKKEATPGPASRQSSTRSSNRLTFETESEFPYPEYLEHIQEKIEGLWFPEGTGIVSIYLIIDRNGKILKSGVDKGTGVGVDKLRESIVRAISLIKRFGPLPSEYEGTALRVRITVRR